MIEGATWPCHFCILNSDRPPLLISFPGFDFGDWEQVGDRCGIVSVNLYNDNPKCAVIESDNTSQPTHQEEIKYM